MAAETHTWTNKGVTLHSLKDLRVSAADIHKELEEVRKKHGEVTAEAALEYAKDKGTKLHKILEWDDTKAAKKFRLLQMRWIIQNVQVEVVSDGQERQVEVAAITSHKEPEPEPELQVVTEDKLAKLKMTVTTQLEELKNKLSGYSNFATAIMHMENALAALAETKTAKPGSSRIRLDGVVAGKKFYFINGKEVRPLSWTIQDDMVILPCEIKNGGKKTVKVDIDQIEEVFGV